MRTLSLCLIFLLSGRDAVYAVTDTEAVEVILGEAAGEGYIGQLAVAEVLRRRGSVQPFCSARRPDIKEFVKKQGKQGRDTALAAWRASEKTNLTQGATHFENVRRYGEPWWGKKMRKVAVVKDHHFYREIR